MKLLDNKLLVGGVCILAAAVLAFLVLPGVYKSKESTVIICKLKEDIPAATKIEKEMIKETEVGSFGLPADVVKSADDIIGKYAKESILSDDLLFLSKFSDYMTDQRLDNLIADGKKLMSVSVGSTAAGVAGHLKAGDFISIVCYADSSVQVFDELKHMEVYGIENSEAISVENAEGDKKADKTAATLTLIVTKAQAHKLAFAEYSGKLHAIFEKRGGSN